MVVYNLAYTTEFDPYFEHGAILAHNFTFDRQHFTIWNSQAKYQMQHEKALLSKVWWRKNDLLSNRIAFNGIPVWFYSYQIVSFPSWALRIAI